MGEIKSTLDLVMEKTKNLSLSKEEREEQKYNEISKKIKGLVQKFQDRILNKDEIEKELNNLEKTYDLKNKNILIDEIVGRIGLSQDNEPLLLLLKDFCGSNVTKFESLLNDFRGTIVSEAKKKIQEIKENLAKKRYISGSAVVPNLEADNGWITEIHRIRDRFDQAMRNEKKRLAV